MVRPIKDSRWIINKLLSQSTFFLVIVNKTSTRVSMSSHPNHRHGFLITAICLDQTMGQSVKSFFLITTRLTTWLSLTHWKFWCGCGVVEAEPPWAPKSTPPISDLISCSSGMVSIIQVALGHDVFRHVGVTRRSYMGARHGRPPAAAAGAGLSVCSHGGAAATSRTPGEQPPTTGEGRTLHTSLRDQPLEGAWVVLTLGLSQSSCSDGLVIPGVERQLYIQASHRMPRWGRCWDLLWDPTHHPGIHLEEPTSGSHPRAVGPAGLGWDPNVGSSNRNQRVPIPTHQVCSPVTQANWS